MRRLLFGIALACLCALTTQASATAPTSTLTRAEAARADWTSTRPPTEGWQTVQLFDLWTRRWPGYDGVVWYRLSWQQDDANRATGLMVEYTSLAAAVYVNGSLVERDISLTEPLSRQWHVPRYFVLQAPLLRQGHNEVWVRVSGLAAYQPGLGPVQVGDPDTLHRAFNREVLIGSELQLFDAAIGFVMASVFGLFWLLRRQDTTYGWYALGGLFSGLYGYNYIARSPWPFPTTDGWQAFNAACFFASVAAHSLFLLRYSGRRFRRTETVLLCLAAGILVAACVFPHWMGPHRDLYIVPAIALAYLINIAFIVFALRNRRKDYVVLAACLSLPILVSFHDLGVYLGWLSASDYLGVITSPLSILGMGFVLAYRFATTMKRVEAFNVELTREVQNATTALTDTLSSQHALELAHSRAGERLQLVRDLHDGFGGTLAGVITRLSNSGNALSNRDVVAMLGEMRDDLRLVIDSTAHEHADLATLIVPLRHRAGRMFEAKGIDDYWSLSGLEGLDLGSSRHLDVLRLLQEALTNVFKHSEASRVDIALTCSGQQLRLTVEDNGRGLVSTSDAKAGLGGAGMASMRQRAMRLGSQLRIDSGEGHTALRVVVDL